MVDEIPMPGGQNGWLEKIVVSTWNEVSLAAGSTEDDQRRRAEPAGAEVALCQLVAADGQARRRASPDRDSKANSDLCERSQCARSARAVAPEDLDAAIGNTLFAQQFLRPPDQWPQGSAPWSGSAWEGDSILAREPRRRAVLIVKLAAELYRREHGKAPANAGALLDRYLKKLPAGIKSDDPIPAGID